MSFCFSGVSYAEEPVVDSVPSVFETFEEDDVMAGLAVVDESELSGIRGGEAPIINLQDLDSVVSGNTVEGTVTTGDSNIGAGAFSNLDGISSVVINTGNNVSIQNSTVVNIVIED